MEKIIIDVKQFDREKNQAESKKYLSRKQHNCASV